MEKYFTMSGFMWRIRILQGNTISKGISFWMSKCNHHFFFTKKKEFQKKFKFYLSVVCLFNPKITDSQRAALRERLKHSEPRISKRVAREPAEGDG